MHMYNACIECKIMHRMCINYYTAYTRTQYIDNVGIVMVTCVY